MHLRNAVALAALVAFAAPAAAAPACDVLTDPSRDSTASPGGAPDGVATPAVEPALDVVGGRLASDGRSVTTTTRVTSLGEAAGLVSATYSFAFAVDGTELAGSRPAPR